MLPQGRKTERLTLHATSLQAKGSDEVSIKELQERTKRAAEETSKAGTSMRDGL